MGTHVEGNETAGYRVVDDKIGPLTSRRRTAEEALEIAGVRASAPASAASDEPDESWTVPKLKRFAADNGVELVGAKKKPEILAAIAAASADEDEDDADDAADDYDADDEDGDDD